MLAPGDCLIASLHAKGEVVGVATLKLERSRGGRPGVIGKPRVWRPDRGRVHSPRCGITETRRMISARRITSENPPSQKLRRSLFCRLLK
jgi:hypothetical protein